VVALRRSGKAMLFVASALAAGKGSGLPAKRIQPTLNAAGQSGLSGCG